MTRRVLMKALLAVPGLLLPWRREREDLDSLPPNDEVFMEYCCRCKCGEQELYRGNECHYDGQRRITAAHGTHECVFWNWHTLDYAKIN